jgi:parallel beta-helix repeat protein
MGRITVAILVLALLLVSGESVGLMLGNNSNSSVAKGDNPRLANQAPFGLTGPPFIGRVCIVPGDSTACPQNLPPMKADSTGNLVVAINILGSTIFNAFGISVRWDPTIMNTTSADITGTILQSPTVSATCINGGGFGCGPHDGPGVAHVDVIGANTTAPASGRLFKIPLVGLPGADPHIGFATGCSTVSIGLASSPGSVPNTDSCVVVGIFATTICTTLCTETLTPVPEGIQSQSLGVHLPTGFASAGGNITGILTSGLAPNYATTWIMPYPITLPGNITSWKAQFRSVFLSNSTPPTTPTAVQIKVLRKTSPSAFTVVEAGPLHDPRPVLQSRLPSYPNGLTESYVIEYSTDTLLTVLPGDMIGLTITSDPQVGSYTYPDVNATTGTRYVPRNVTISGTIDLSDVATATLLGVAPALEVSIQPSPPTLDTTGDGIPDFVALSPEMQALEVDPCRTTVLVQLDYMVPASNAYTHRPLQAALDLVTAAFDSAPIPPITNCPYLGFPKKTTGGINLIFDVRNAIPQQDTLNFTRSEPQSFDTIKAALFDPNRIHYFHYGLFIHKIVAGQTTSGVAETFGSNFMVSLGNWTNNVGSVFEQAGTLMHELGHNLGLRHGGGDEVNFKPNYLSVMSWEHQVVGILSRTPTGDVAKFDYSREALPTLNESNLNEWASLSSANNYTKWVCPDHHTVERDVVSNSLDWNCDRGLETSASNDLNNDTLKGLLTGFNDWSNLRFKFIQSTNFNVGCRVGCDIGCRVGCDIGCRVGCDFGVAGDLDFKAAQVIEASWTAFVASPHRSTSTSINCSPSSVAVSTPSSCIATVTDNDAGTPINLAGTVSFKSGQPGSFTPSTCSFAGTGATAACSVNYSPGIASVGPQTITAGYAGDTNHLDSSGSATVTGLPLPSIITITSNTKLRSDVTARIVIGADGITLNCDGHTISGITTAPATPLMNNGITINGRNGVSILNCNVTNFYIGVQLASSNGTFLNGNTATGNGYGFFLSSSNLNHLATNNASRNGLDGFRLVSSNANGLAGNTANGNSGSGFSLLSSNFNALTGNTASRNGLNGFLLVFSNSNGLLGNTANSNGSYGFALISSNSNAVQMNTACGNGLFDAFQTGSTGNKFRNNEFCTTSGL